MDKQEKIPKVVIRISLILFILLGIIIIYQLSRYLLGGSWSSDDLLMTLVVTNTVGLFSLGYTMVRLQVTMKYEFRILRHEFKSELNRLEHEFKRFENKLDNR